MTALPIVHDGGLVASRSEKLRVRSGSFDRTFEGATGRIGKLIFRRDEHGWVILDTGVQGGVHLDGCRLQQLPLFVGRPVEVQIGVAGSGPVNRVQFEVIPGPVTARPNVVPLSAASPEVASLVVDRISVRTPEGRVLVQQATFALPVGTLTAVIGPSGAGKSTLLRALTGAGVRNGGRVSWRGCDLDEDQALMRTQIGLVPQEEILHPQLSVRQSLDFAARLRLPAGASSRERDDAVVSVLERMGLKQRAEVRIENLSGGQRKRVSIATELLTAPPLLFLDEPTSGLDPGLDRAVVDQLRGLADEGRVVVMATHSVMGLDACDTVVALARGGVVAYVGPPDGLLDHFGCADHPELFDLLQHGKVAPASVTLAREARRFVRQPVPVAPSPWMHLSTLVRRNLAVMRADRLLVAMLIALPLLLALLTRVVQGGHGLSLSLTRAHGVLDGTEAGQRLTILVVAAGLLGVAMTVREFVGERAVFRREYAVGLSPGVYHLSKALVFAPICFGQGIAVTWLASLGLPGPDQGGVHGWGWWEVALPVGLLAATMALVGLWVSAAVHSADHTMPALVAVVMAQMVLSSALVHLAGRPLLNQLSWLAPARWGYAAAAASSNLDRAAHSVRGAIADPLFTPSVHQWWFNLALLSALALVALLGGRVAVRHSLGR